MPERPLGYPLALAWAILSAAGLLVVAGVTVRFRPEAAYDIVNLGAVEALVFTLVTFGVLRIHAPGRRARAALGLRPTHAGLSALGLGLGVCLQVPAASLRQVVERLSPTPDSVLRGKAALLFADTTAQLVALLVVTACVAPLVEELFVRGALYGALCRSHSLLGAAAMSGFCFLAIHWEWRNWPSLVVVAAVLSHLRAVSGSLLPGLFLHVAFNAATILALFTGLASVTRPPEIGVSLTVGGWLATLGLVGAVQMLARRSSEADRARVEDLR